MHGPEERHGSHMVLIEVHRTNAAAWIAQWPLTSRSAVRIVDSLVVNSGTRMQPRKSFQLCV